MDWLHERRERYLSRTRHERLMAQYQHNVISAVPSKFQELRQRISNDVVNYNGVFSGLPELTKCHAVFEEHTRAFSVTVQPRQLWVTRAEAGTVFEVRYREFPGPTDKSFYRVDLGLQDDLSVGFKIDGEFASLELVSQRLLDPILCG